jgi:hypothetical protein
MLNFKTGVLSTSMTAKPAAIAVIAAVSVSVIVTAAAKAAAAAIASIGAAAVYLSPKREGGFLFSALPGTSGGPGKGKRPGQQQRCGCDNGSFPFFVHLYTPVKRYSQRQRRYTSFLTQDCVRIMSFTHHSDFFCPCFAQAKQPQSKSPERYNASGLAKQVQGLTKIPRLRLHFFLLYTI